MIDRWRRANGFTLLECLIAVVLAALLASLPVFLWREQGIRLRQAEARVALMHNGRFLEQWFAEHQFYAGIRTPWPVLPVRGTEHYLIEFGARREHRQGHYRLRATARFAWLGTDFLIMDQDGKITLCHEQDSRVQCKEESGPPQSAAAW